MSENERAEALCDLKVPLLDKGVLERLENALPRLLRAVHMELPKREISKVERDTECVVCCTERRSVAFGCGHLCVCVNCADDVRDCPMCRKPVTARTRLFLS